jgi:hypothetical protein
VLVELGYLPFSQAGGRLLSSLLSKQYEKKLLSYLILILILWNG